MSRSAVRGFLAGLAVCLFAFLVGSVPSVWAQSSSTGTVSVTVLDPDGRAVPDADLTLQDLSTNDVRRATTQANGTYSFVNLSLGTYKMTVSKKGFDSQAFDSIAVHATQVTDISATLKVGVATETVEVHESETPLVETSSNAITTTVDMKQLEQLPLNGRDVSQLAFLTPGYSGVPGNGNGTWNGLPVIAQGNNVDGVISSTSRMKFSGNQTPTIEARLEDMQEMTVQSDQLDLSTGFGATDMQVNFVTRRGSNSFHGRAFDNLQNNKLNANSWNNNAAGIGRNHLRLNDFGGSLGGPILKNKLFFFGSFAMLKQPGGYTTQNQVLVPAAQGGAFTFTGTDGAVHTVQLIGANSVASNSGINNTPDARVASEISAINGVESLGALTANASDPNVDNLNFFVPSPITYYFPAIRVDYNASENVRINFAWNETKENQPGNIAPWFPGSAFANSAGEFLLSAYTAGIGLDWTIKPTLVNQFRGGFLYNYTNYGKGAAAPTAGSSVNVQWDLPYSGFMSGDGFQQPTSQYYPLFNWSDNVSWQHGAHTFAFGASWYREQDHYWNPPAGIVFSNFGLVTGDPALNPVANALTAANAGPAALSEGEQLYSVLTGDIGNPNGPAATVAYALDPNTKQYLTNSTRPFVLDELQKGWGLFFQDSFRIKSNLTLNYGLRWDFTGDDHDLKNAYESVATDGVFAVSGPGNFFKPGVLNGNQNPLFTASGHQYKPWNVSPQPQIGVAWTPNYTDGVLGKLTAGGQSVVRAGFSFRNYTEPYQFFWDAATDYGAFFYQNNQILDNPSGGQGLIVPGSVTLQSGSSNFPASAFQNLTPSYTTTFPEAGLTFSYPYQQIRNPGIALGAINQNIKQPYTESWNLSIQRPIGRNNAIELRYIGSRSVHQWLNLFTDEVNIFENGFLTQFKAAQNNLAVNAANGMTGSNASFSDQTGFGGIQATPIMDQAFTGVGAAGGFQNSNFISFLQGGAAGAFATALAGGPGGNPTYFCNLVDANNAFPACATNGSYSGAGGSYPINFFQMNPLNTGQDVGYTTAAGYSNYNGLQVDFRQKQWHGMQFDVNYTWSHTLGINTQNSWTGVFNQFSLRNLRQSYGPLPFDIRHSVHANGTYDLPFGLGKAYLNQNHLLDRVVGGWSVGTVLTLQSGEPFELLGSPFDSAVGANLSTYNDFADSGVTLNGVTVGQLQKSVSVYHVAGAPFVDLINPKYIGGAGANPTYITSNTVPGTIGTIPWIHGPRFFNQDVAVTKAIPITERLRFTFQGEFLNAFNHPNFGLTPGANVTSNNFGTAGPVFVGGSPTDGARAIELRANLEF